MKSSFHSHPLGVPRLYNGDMNKSLGLGLLGAIILLGCWLRWQLVVHDPLWIDELHTSWVLSGKPGEVAPRAIVGNQSPLYFWLSYGLVNGLGQSPLSLRLVSLLAGVGVLCLGTSIVWWVTRSLLAAGTTALALAIESQLLFYSSEARPYALVQLGGLLFTWQAFQQIRSVEQGVGWSVCLLALLLVLVHPTTIILTLCVALLLFLNRRFPQPLDGVGIVLASLLGVLLNPATSTWFSRRSLWQGLDDQPQLLGLILGLVFGAWIAPLLARWLMQLRDPLRERRHEPVLASQYADESGLSAATFWLGCFLLPTAAAVSLSWTGIAGLATPRYLAAVWSFPAIGLGLLVSGLPWKRGLAIAALGIFLLAFGLVAIPQPQGWQLIRTNPLAVSLARERSLVGMRSEGWDTICQRMLEQPDLRRQRVWLYPNLIEDELVGRADPGSEQLKDYLTFALRGLYAVPAARIEPRAFRAAQLLEAEDQRLLREEQVWVVVRCAPDELTQLEDAWQADWLRLGGREKELPIERRWSAGNVHLLSLGPASQPGRTEQSQ